MASTSGSRRFSRPALTRSTVRAVFEDPNLATPASATKSVCYGELSLWTIKQRPIRMAVSSDYPFNLDNIDIKSVYRAGGALPDAAGSPTS